MTYPGLIAKEGAKKKKPSLINQNIASRSRSDEKEGSGTSADDAKEGFSDVTFGITLKQVKRSPVSVISTDVHGLFFGPTVELKWQTAKAKRRPWLRVGLN